LLALVTVALLWKFKKLQDTDHRRRCSDHRRDRVSCVARVNNMTEKDPEMDKLVAGVTMTALASSIGAATLNFDQARRCRCPMAGSLV